MKFIVKISIILCVVVALIVLFGLPPTAYVERWFFTKRADHDVKQILTPNVPHGYRGDVFQYQDGWIVMIYGQSSWSGHNAWNYNLAKDSNGIVYLSVEHFCSPVRVQGETFIRYEKDHPGKMGGDSKKYSNVITADTVIKGIQSLKGLGFIRK